MPLCMAEYIDGISGYKGLALAAKDFIFVSVIANESLQCYNYCTGKAVRVMQ